MQFSEKVKALLKALNIQPERVVEFEWSDYPNGVIKLRYYLTDGQQEAMQEALGATGGIASIDIPLNYLPYRYFQECTY